MAGERNKFGRTMEEEAAYSKKYGITPSLDPSSFGISGNTGTTGISGEAQSPVSPSGVSIYGSPEERAGETAGRQTASIYYGSTPDIGAAAADYRKRVAGNLDKSSGLANRYIQSANADISRGNVRAGLGGVDTSASSTRERRGAMAKADEMQQQFGQQNLATYGKSIGAGISGTESLAAAGKGQALAATPGQTPSYGGGFFGSIICTELYRQNKLTIKELLLCREFGESISNEEYFGYLVLAKPIVRIMKKSDLFSNLWIGWAKSIASKNPNNFIKIMLPVCKLIGSLKLEICYAK